MKAAAADPTLVKALPRRRLVAQWLQSGHGRSPLVTRVVISLAILLLHAAGCAVLCLSQPRLAAHSIAPEMKATIIDEPLQRTRAPLSASDVHLAPIRAALDPDIRADWGGNEVVHAARLGQVTGSRQDRQANRQMWSVADMIVRPQLDAAPAPSVPHSLLKRPGERARRMVRVAVFVQPDGSVSDMIIEGSSGIDTLDQTAMSYAQRSHYIPGSRNGESQAMWTSIVVTFGPSDKVDVASLAASR